MKTVKCPNCRKYIVLPATTCAHCGAELSDAIREQAIVAKIRKIRDAHEADWLRQPNIVMVATRKDANGLYYIAIGVIKLEEAADVPEVIDGVSVRIEHVGQIRFAENAS